jgi:hypothetical protein
MKLLKGLNLDVRPEDQPQETYPYGKNGLQYNLKGAITNEEGFKRIRNIIPAGYQINGIIETDGPRVVVYHTNNESSRVMVYNLTAELPEYIFDDTTLSYKLGFKIDNYITGQTQRNHKGELICVFTDKVTFPKFINLDKPEVSSLKSWRLFPEFTVPTVDKQVISGGNIAVGSYYVATRYLKTDGTVTSFSRVSSGVVIADEDGNDFADKSIELTISDQDTSYTYLEVAVISKIKGVTKVVLMDKTPVVPGISVVQYTGDGEYTDITLEEVLTSQVRYEKAGTIAQLNDALYVGNLEKLPDITDMQKYANLIKLEWVSDLQDVMNPSEELINGTKKGFMHEEVYAFYIRYRFKNGSYSLAFTIPGVAMTPTGNTTSPVATTGLTTGLVYEAEDQITAFNAASYSGMTGPYHNKTERYPDTEDFDSSSLGGVNLRDQSVRHHRMPSLRWCKEHLYSSVTDYGTGKLDVLGIRASNIQIPSQYADLIDGYEILYAKRTVQNMTVYGQSIVINGAKLSNTSGIIDNITVYSTGHNWSTIGTQGFGRVASNMRFHALDLLLNRPGIKPSHLSHQYRIETNIKTFYVPWSYPTGGNPADGKGASVHFSDMTITGGATTTPVGSNFINGLEDCKYIKNHTVLGDYQNTYMETAFVGEQKGPEQPLSSVPNYRNPSYSTSPKVQAYLANLCDIKNNVYDSFYSQPLISAGDPKELSNLSAFWGGDVFPSLYTFHTYGLMDEEWAVPYSSGPNNAFPEQRTRRIVHRVICETISNHFTRYEIPGNIYSKWYDHNPLSSYALSANFAVVYPVDFNSTLDPNQIGYNKGAEGVNDFVISDVYTPYREYEYKFPYRIHRGGKLSRTNSRSWKTFLALDYYEVQKNMGFLVHLEGMDDRLLIHCENALFVTQDKAKLETGLLGVTLGAGDLFQFEPQEAQPAKLGYGGTQHDLACIKTPIGYLYPDSKQGELFLYHNNKLQLLNQDLYRFLREYLRVQGNNCYNGNSITVGWDQKYRRFLLTVNNRRPIGVTDPKVIEASYITAVNDGTQVLSCLNGQLNNFEVNVGEIVFMDGKFLEYMGLNNPAVTGETCPSDPIPCLPVVGVAIDEVSDTEVNVTWSGSGTFQWNFYYQNSSSVWVLISSGTTALNTLNFTGLSTARLYKFEIIRVCGGITSIPSMAYFSTTPVVGEDPADVCASTGTFTNIVDTLGAWQSNPANVGNFGLLCWRIRTNGGTWSILDEFGSNPSYTLDTPTFEACVEVEIGVQYGGNFYLPTDVGFPGWIHKNCATQNLAVSCVNRLTPPPLSTSAYMSNSFTDPFFQPYNYMKLMTPDPTTFYNNTDRHGNLVGAYWRFKTTLDAWVGGGTTIADPLLGTVGPLGNLKLWIHEPN